MPFWDSRLPAEEEKTPINFSQQPIVHVFKVSESGSKTRYEVLRMSPPKYTVPGTTCYLVYILIV